LKSRTTHCHTRRCPETYQSQCGDATGGRIASRASCSAAAALLCAHKYLDVFISKLARTCTKNEMSAPSGIPTLDAGLHRAASRRGQHTFCSKSLVSPGLSWASGRTSLTCLRICFEVVTVVEQRHSEALGGGALSFDAFLVRLHRPCSGPLIHPKQRC
jgi:hypothetical protein